MFSKLVNFWVNKAVTETLMKSPKFHEFAAKTHRNVSKMSENAPSLTEATNRAQIFAKAFRETLIKESENMAKRK
ncbi:hypothetical protein DFQ27_008752 [Actinomortierella ambigua]|uniref:Uncharacterized protein n=1 Tax=Actinomortierella ambigua TaxID=1343610 RepID=A0A9P6QJC2_9FUNG|nr:hypothetical protein DFQ26_007646 [Actinomortierella ambigua]KAG0267461.1 hypothetical protein DFQ27_008752 [Actinomortierella ambigua]